nr:hypothetical protein [uncultured Pseudomonas sp.]
MTPALGKFDRYPLMRQTARWEWQLGEAVTFNDPEVGPITVPAGYRSDLASIRILREVFRWFVIVGLLLAALSLLLDVPLALAVAACVLAALAILLYAAIAGYGNRMGAVHDFLYGQAKFPKAVCDQVLWRMARTGEGMARWRAAIFYLGPVLGGARYYGYEG